MKKMGKKIILVIDDSFANLQLCRGLLRGEYDVRLAKSGEMALNVLANVKPDIILLDIMMPDMSGFEFIREIGEDAELRAIPVIFVTAHVTGEYLSDAASCGAANYVVKPFAADVLRAKIQNALNNRRADSNNTIFSPQYINP
ncbi:MAG: response regulator [Oscillospiraceae bacterium]|nr:response regulator [Oscillospiraceae bacterium]